MYFRNILKALGQITEAETKDTKTGRVHKGDYGTSYEAGDEGVKKAETTRGRGRPKKGSDEATGEVKKYDSSALGKAFGGGQKPKGEVGKKSVKHSLKEYIETVEESIVEGETIEKKGGRVHKGSYGSSYEAGDEGMKKAETTRGRGRPKKGADDSTGEVKKYDTKSLGAAFGGGKAPKKPIGKVSASHKLKETEALTVKPMPGASQLTGPDGKPIATADAATANMMKQAAQQGKLTIGGQTDDQGMNEGAKPDFLDVDKDKNKKESFKKAVKDKESRKKKVAESISFNEMSAETQTEAQEMLAELQDDIETFVNTGHCSDKLEAFLKIHGHSKKKITDEGSIQDFTTHGMDSRPSKFVSVPANPKPTPFSVDPIQATTDRAGSFIKSIMAPKKTNPFESKEMKDIQLESWESQLNSLLTEGITVSSSQGQQGAPDSVTITATDGDSEQLLTVLRQAGIGVFGGQDTPMSQYGAPMQTGGEPEGQGAEPEMAPTVVGDGDGMMALIKKMTGIQDGSDQGGEPEGTMSADYEDEEGSEEQGFGGEEEYASSEEGSEESSGEEEYADDEEQEEVTDEGNAFTGKLKQTPQGGKFSVGGKQYKDTSEIEEGGEETCETCHESQCQCDSEEEQVEEGFANEAGHEELAQLKAMLNMGNDMHRPKQSQATGNIQKVTMETKLMSDSLNLISDWKKLSGIK